MSHALWLRQRGDNSFKVCQVETLKQNLDFADVIFQPLSVSAQPVLRVLTNDTHESLSSTHG
jgi:hypothetical protein